MEKNTIPQTVEMALADLIPYANNPRNNDGAVDAVAASIAEFGFKVPIVIDKDNVIVAGHTRYKAAQKLKWEKVPCIVADDLTPAQVKAFRLADNKVAEAAEWDMELLALELDDIDMDMTLFGFEEEEPDLLDKYEKTGEGLVGRFIVPPLSVLDTRQKYWQDRKHAWLEITGDLSETRDGEFGRLSSSKNSIVNSFNGGTSNFDPVLAEIMYRWFCVQGGKILDPFGGEQTKGVVAGELGYQYTGCEIRQEQVDLDTEKTKQYPGVKYICGDSTKLSEYIPERDFDMCFTSPPYYDLEVYSKDDMSALGTYEEFMAMYRTIFEQCYAMMKEDTFLVIKIGEIRNKKTGEYRSFVPDNAKMFVDIGFKYYNELILYTPAGTAPIRATQSMNTRKVTKTHQNVLVFYKGELKNIATKYPKLDFTGVEDIMGDVGDGAGEEMEGEYADEE